MLQNGVPLRPGLHSLSSASPEMSCLEPFRSGLAKMPTKASWLSILTPIKYLDPYQKVRTWPSHAQLLSGASDYRPLTHFQHFGLKQSVHLSSALQALEWLVTAHATAKCSPMSNPSTLLHGACCQAMFRCAGWGTNDSFSRLISLSFASNPIGGTLPSSLVPIDQPSYFEPPLSVIDLHSCGISGEEWLL